ncbi:hypothetical protein AAG906_038655 [Vitis piasezkii]
MSSSLLLMEPMGGSFGRFLRLARCPCCGYGGLGLPCSSFLTGSSRHRRVWLMRPHDILILVLALSLLLGLLNADDEEALMLKPGCVILRFLLLIFLSPRGELSVVARLPTVFFRWLGDIRVIFLSLTG